MELGIRVRLKSEILWVRIPPWAQIENFFCVVTNHNFHRTIFTQNYCGGKRRERIQIRIL